MGRAWPELLIIVLAWTSFHGWAGMRSEAPLERSSLFAATASLRDAVEAPPRFDQTATRKDRDPVVGNVGLVRYATTLHNLHTRELLPVSARNDGSLPSQQARQRFLRCRVTGHVHEMADLPFATALAAARHFEADRIEVVSGFRSPKFNEHLRKKGHAVAAKSRHMSGEALDFRLPGVPAPRLARYAGSRFSGGIGTYLENDFIHLDVGPPRAWRGL